MSWSYEILDAKAEAILRDVGLPAGPGTARAVARHLRTVLDELCQEAIAQSEAGTGDPETGDMFTSKEDRERLQNAVVFCLEVARVRSGLTASTPRRVIK